MNIVEFVELFKDNILVQAAATIFIFTTLLLITITQYFKFHNGNIKYGKSKYFESALDKFPINSDDYYLFQETFAQEAFYVNTKIYASKTQRHQITEWMINNSTPINIIKKAWPAITIKNGIMETTPTKWDTIYFWFSFASIIVFIATAFPVSIYALTTIYDGGSHTILFYPALLLTLIISTYKNIEPVIFLRKLHYRLNN